MTAETSSVATPRPLAARAFAPADGGALTIEVRRDADLPEADLAALRGLVAGRPELGIFLSAAWLQAWWAEPADRAEQSLVVLRQGGCVRGIVPLAISRRGRFVRIRLMGGGDQSDRTDLLAERQWECACADVLLAWFEEAYGRHGYVLELRDVPHDSLLWAAMHRSNTPLVPVVRDVHPAPYVDLRDDRGGATAASPRSIASSRSLEKHRRWLEARGRLRVEQLHDPAEALAAFDVLVRLLHLRWEGRRGRSAMDDPWRQRFHRRAIPLLLADGHLRMVRISSDLRTIGVAYGLAVGDWWGSYQTVYDREWAGRIHLGRLAFTMAMDVAAQSGATVFDFLKGAEPVKYLWPVRDRITVDADIYSARAWPQLLRAGRASRELAGALLNVVRGAVRVRPADGGPR